MLVIMVGLVTVSTIFLPTKNRTTRRMLRFTVVEMPIAQGLGFTASRSGTGIGLEVSSSGGSFGGKNTSRMLSQSSTQMGFSSYVLPIKASTNCWSFAMAAAASVFES